VARGLDTESDGGSRIVEVAEVLDVVAVAAVRVERTRTLGMRRDGVRLQREVRLQPRNAGDGLAVTRRAAVVDVVLTGPDRIVPGIHRADGVRVRSVETEFELRHVVRVAGVVQPTRMLTGDHRDVGVHVAGNDPLEALD